MSKFENAMGRWFELVMRKKLLEQDVAVSDSKDNPIDKHVKWEDIKGEVLQILRKKSGLTAPNITLVDGFVSINFSQDVPIKTIFDRTTIPMVAIINDDTGQIYIYALKALMKDLDI